MDKVQIKGLVQGKIKLKDGTFAVAFKTLYGNVWVTANQFPRLFLKNPHLKRLFKELDGRLMAEDFIGMYLYIKNKRQEVEINGIVFERPVL